jgi:hypothetical protein
MTGLQPTTPHRTVRVTYKFRRAVFRAFRTRYSVDKVSAPEQGVFPRIAIAAGESRDAAARQAGLELIAIHTVVKKRLGHGRGFQSKSIRMKMQHDACVRLNTFSARA